MHLGYSTYVCKNEMKITAACSVFTLLLHKAEPERPWINEHNIVHRRFDVHVGYFDVLLTVHLSIILVINQPDAQNLVS